MMIARLALLCLVALAGCSGYQAARLGVPERVPPEVVIAEGVSDAGPWTATIGHDTAGQICLDISGQGGTCNREPTGVLLVGGPTTPFLAGWTSAPGAVSARALLADGSQVDLDLIVPAPGVASSGVSYFVRLLPRDGEAKAIDILGSSGEVVEATRLN